MASRNQLSKFIPLENLFPTFSTDCILAVVSLRERAGVRAIVVAPFIYPLTLTPADAVETGYF